METVKDIVCGMDIEQEKAAGQSRYDGQDYYFCSLNCKIKFDTNPESFVHGAAVKNHKESELDKKQVSASKTHSDLIKLDIPVEGMSCASCAMRVERSLASLPGTEHATVNFATEKASVTFHPNQINVKQIAETIQSAGYGVRQESIRVGIEGMTCASCVNRVEKAIKTVPGVLNASVNLGTEEATIRYITHITSAQDIAKAIGSSGYKAIIADEEELEDVERSLREKKYKILLIKLFFAAAFTVPILILSFSDIFTFVHYIPEQVRWLLLFFLTFPVILYPGAQFYKGAWSALKNKAADMNTLIAIGTGSAFIYSSLATFFPALLPGGLRTVYFDTAAVIITLILLGKFLEARAKGRTSEAIKKLMGLQPKTARVIRHGQEIDIPIKEVLVGDEILVRPGEKIPVDGQVTQARPLWMNP